MLKNLVLRRLLIFIIIFNMLFCQTAMAININTSDTVNSEDIVAVFVDDALPNEEVTILVYSSDITNPADIQGEDILYIDQLTADKNGKVNFLFRLRDGTTAGEKKIAIGSTSSASPTYRHIIVDGVEKEVYSISVQNPKTEYGIGESFDYSTGNVLITYTDESTATIPLNDSRVTISGFDSTYIAENQEVTATVKEKQDSWFVNIIDKNAPTIPEILTVVNVTGSTIELSWTESTDDAKIEKYEVYRNGSKIGETSTTTYVDTGLSLDVKYTYYVIAVDKNGNFSEQSTTISATTALPKINRIVPVTGTAFGGTTKTLSLYAANLNNAKNSALSVKYRKANAEWETLNASAITLAETTTDEYKYNISLNMSTWTSAEYEFEFILTDETGEKASYSAIYDIDCQAPAKINNFVATAGEANVLLSWEMGNEIDITKYIIYRSVDGSSFEKYKEISGRGNTYFTDSSVTIGTKYSYKISAIDGYNQEGVLSDVVEATPQKDSTAPNIMSISPAQGTVLTGSKTITVKASDNIGVSSIELQYSIDNGATFKTLETKNNAATASFNFDSSKVTDGTIQIRAIATDTSGNVSDGQPVYTYIVDNTGPNKISDFKSSSKTYTTITLEWASIEDSDYSYCIVEKKSGTSWANCAKTTTVLGANITGLSPETEYTFRVVAYDKYGNRGEASDEVTVTTEADTESPVITSINPKPASFSSSIAVQITAKDSYKVKKLTIETSTDAKNWTEETLLELDIPVSSKTFSYTLNLSDKSEGVLYVRGVAEDIYGNKSDSSEAAPYVQYNVDKTAPATPNDVKLICYGGYLELKWTQGTDSDLKGYNVYRSTSKNSGYSKVASSITKVNYIDSNVSLGQVYYYKVQAIDTAGNIGEFSEVVSGEMLADTEAPVIKSWNYSNGVTIQKTNTLNILATDNNLLSKMTLEYKTAETEWTLLETKTGNQNSYIFKFAVSSLVDGTYSFRAKTTDASGNKSNYSNEMTYTFDSTAPKINEVTVTPNEGSITVKWTGNNEQDLAGYYIYRKTTGSYSKVASYSNNGNITYEFTDTNVNYGINYTYRIETFDIVGNKNTHTTSAVMPLYVYVEPKPDTTKPNITCTIPSTMQQAVEEYFDATRCTDDTEISTYHWDFGDGTTSSKAKSVHSYSELGKYTVTLTVTDTSGNTSTASKTVTVVEKKMAGTLKIKVVDDSGNKVSGAGVFYKLGTDDMVSYATNANGEVTITDYSGTYDVGVYADGYLPAKQSVSIVNNADNSLTIRIIKKEIIVGELTYTRMTFEEIVAAGIDPYAPENQYVYKYEINLTFGTSNYTGTAIKSQSTSNVQPVKITNWTQTSGTASDTTLKGGYVWIIGDDSNNDNYNQSYTSNAKQIVAVLEVPGETSWLKEFFDVQLHIHNQAEESFVIDDCVATLNYPTDGLTLMTDLVDGYSETQTVNIGSIAGQEHKYINWVLRGDEPGDYDISADFSGRLRDFNEEINAKFECSEPIHVNSNAGLSIDIEIEDTIDDEYLFFNTVFKNISGREITLMSLAIDGIQPYDEMYCSVDAAGKAEYNVDNNHELISTDHMVIKNNQGFRKRYKVNFKEFATYINPNIDWDSDFYTISSYLFDFFVRNLVGIEIPINKVELNISKEVSGNYQAMAYTNGDTGSFTSRYSEGYFRNPSTKYNHAMAKSSLVLALAGMNSSETTIKYDDVIESDVSYWKFDNNSTEKMTLTEQTSIKRASISSQNIIKLYKEMGFNDSNISVFDYDRDINGEITDRAAFSIASKKIITAGEEKTLIAVVVRSGNYGNEWGSNFRLANPENNWLYSDPYHYAFNRCAEYVSRNVSDYISENGIDNENIKIWITGFSRGAVTANMAAAKLNKIYGKENIYAYTFATPQGIKTYGDDLTTHDNIFNVINPTDLVPRVALSNPGWDYSRYGVSLYLPSKLSTWGYNSMYENVIDNEVSMRMEAFKNNNSEGSYLESEDKYIYRETDQEKAQILLLSTLWSALPTDKQYHILQPYIAPLAAMMFNPDGKNGIDYSEMTVVELSEMYDVFFKYIDYVTKIEKINSTEEAIEFINKTISTINTLQDNCDEIQANSLKFSGEVVEAAATIARFIYVLINYSGIVDAITEVASTGGLSAAISIAKVAQNIMDMKDAVVYAMNGINANHMPEIYAAWLNSNSPDVLFEQPAYKAIRIGYVAKTTYDLISPFSINEADSVEELPEKDYVNIYVYNKNNELVACVVNGEITENGVLVNVFGDDVEFYLPENTQYRIEMVSDSSVRQNYSVKEYKDYTLSRSVSYEGCIMQENDNVTLNIADTDNDYSVISSKGEIIESEIKNDVLDEEIVYHTLIINKSVGGMAFGEGKIQNNTYAKLEASPLAGYIFDGWFDKNNNLLSEQLEYSILITEDSEIKAKFIPRQNTINFVSDDNSGIISSLTANTNETITLPNNTFTKEGYKFAGWLAEVDDEKVFLPEGAEYTVTCDVEFEAVWVGIDMQIGAAVRTTSPTGLRFYTRIDTESYNAIKALDDEAKCGTLISPLDYFTDGVYTMEWLSANNRSFLDIENIAFAEENLLYKEYRGVISNIMDKNYNRLFVGRGYIQFTYTNGEKNTIYTDFSQEDNARAVAAVAKKALEDTSANYTAAQIAVLEQFAASYEEE